MLSSNVLTESLSGFAEHVRRKGLLVSTSEVIDGVSAVEALAPSSLREMNDILQFCLVKNISDLEKYDKAFWEYFLSNEKITVALAVIRSQQEEKKANIHGRKQIENKNNNALKPQEGDRWQSLLIQYKVPESFKNYLKKEKHLSAAQLSRQPLTDSDKKSITIAVGKLTQRNEISTCDLKDVLSYLKGYTKLAREVEKMRSVNTKKPTVHVSHSEIHSWTTPALYSSDISPSLLNVNLSYANKDQLAQLTVEAEKVATRLKPDFARNPGLTHKKLILDYKRTLHKSLATFGEPFYLINSAKRCRLRRLVTICDVSGSVKNVTGLLTAFLYGLHQSFEGRTKHFIFVSEIDEVTPYFSASSYKDCYDRIMQSAAIDYRGYSNYGNMLEKLWKKNRSIFDHETVVIVLGDARTNRYDPRTDIMGNIRTAAKKVFFLNPEHRSKWYMGDSAIRYYEKVVRIIEISKFADLLKFLNMLPGMVVAS